MKIVKKIALLISIILTVVLLSSCKKNQDDSNVFYFSSYKTFEKVPYEFYYEDSYFLESSTTYNNHLMSLSSCLALAGGSSVSGTDYKNTPTNIKYFFNKLGFTSFKSNNYGVSKPTKDSFGVYLAKKEIGDYTVIGIGVRGFGYLSEWASNFNLGGNDSYAEGFYSAGTIYIDTLKQYILDNNITGKIKIWTAGYSRGAAGVNMAIGRIDDNLKNGVNILSDVVTYTKEDIYAYCFEAPCGKVKTLDSSNNIVEKGEDYNNIYCIVNLNDLVCYVAPKNLGYVRYGIDYFLPDIITSLSYQDEIDNLKEIYNNLPNSSVLGEYDIDTFRSLDSDTYNETLGLLLMKLFDVVSNSIGTRANYYNNFETPLCNLAETIFSNNNAKEILIDFGINFAKRLVMDDPDEILIKDALYNKKRFFQDLKPIVERTLERSSKINVTYAELETLVKSLVPVIIDLICSNDGFSIVMSLLVTSNLNLLMKGHIPELLLSFVTSLDSNYGYTDYKLTTSYYILKVSKDSYIEISNNGNYLYNNIESSLLRDKDDEYIIFYLPKEKYDIYIEDADVILYEVNNSFDTPKEKLNTTIINSSITI